MSDGDTPEEAIANGLDAAKSWLATAKEFKDPIPRAGQSYSSKVVTVFPRVFMYSLWPVPNRTVPA